MKHQDLKLEISFLLFMWICMSSFGFHIGRKTIKFDIINKCPCKIWPAIVPSNGYPLIAKGGFALPSGKSKQIKISAPWIGRFWGRTGCKHNSSQPSCETGDCDGLLSCNGAAGIPPATLIEMSLEPTKSGSSFYVISLVDGYNLPVSMSAKPANSSCLIEGCQRSVNNECPAELQVLGRKGDVVACKSPCLAFGSDMYCCRNLNGTAESCEANDYSEMFKSACPSYVSYAFDTPLPLAECSSKEYVITFCPSKWGLSQTMSATSGDRAFAKTAVI